MQCQNMRFPEGHVVTPAQLSLTAGGVRSQAMYYLETKAAGVYEEPLVPQRSGVLAPRPDGWLPFQAREASGFATAAQAGDG